ncbi:hypothetical protein [Amphritea sp. HPY]|uniref:hypothetical protein n=1 Tax=Amphritea sp. HPY TaxID=3421652 RepID=UPI003D7DDBE3
MFRNMNVKDFSRLENEEYAVCNSCRGRFFAVDSGHQELCLNCVEQRKKSGKKRSKYFFALRSVISINPVISIISILLATISISKLVFDIFTLEPIELFQNIYTTYAVLFYTAFDFIFMWLPVHIPPIIKDLFALYIIMATTVYRTLQTKGQRRASVWLETIILIRMAFLWPYYIHFAVGGSAGFMEGQTFHIVRIRPVFVFRLIAVILSTLFVIAVNYAYSI